MRGRACIAAAAAAAASARTFEEIANDGEIFETVFGRLAVDTGTGTGVSFGFSRSRGGAVWVGANRQLYAVVIRLVDHSAHVAMGRGDVVSMLS